MGNKWTPEEIEVLERVYPVSGSKGVQALLCDRSLKAIWKKAKRLSIPNERTWTEFEIETLRRIYPLKGSKGVYKLLPNRTLRTINTKASSMGIFSADFWSDAEIGILKEYYLVEGIKGCQKRLPNRTYSAVSNQAGRLGIEKNIGKWENWENQILKDFYFIEGIKSCCEKLSCRTEYSIQHQLRKLKITRKWKDEENQILKDFYFTEGSKGCHKRLAHRSRGAIKRQAHKLGIKGVAGLKDLTGLRFGKLLVIKRGEDYVTSKEAHYPQWWTECDCGKEKLIRANALVHGKAKSCGNCPQLEIGKMYGYLEPIERVGDGTERTSGRHYQRFRVKCHYGAKGCKGEFIVRARSIKKGSNISCGCFHNEMIGIRSTKPEGAHITPLVTRYYTCTKYHELQNERFDLDNNCCVILGKLPRRLLTVHHIIPRNYYFKKYNITTKEQMYACRELWDINNLVTISEEWHLGIKTNNPEALHRVYNGNVYTEEDYYKWLENIKNLRGE